MVLNLTLNFTEHHWWDGKTQIYSFTIHSGFYGGYKFCRICVEAFRERQYCCLGAFCHLSESDCDSDDQQTSHVATFQAQWIFWCPTASHSVWEFCAPHGRDTMRHLMRHSICHMSGDIFLSNYLKDKALRITSGFYRQIAPNSGFPSDARAFLATRLLKPLWAYFHPQKYISYDWALWAINILEINQKSKMHLIYQHESQSEDATKPDCPFTTEWDKTGLPNFPKCHPGTNTPPSSASDTSKQQSKLETGCPFAIFSIKGWADKHETTLCSYFNNILDDL